MDMRMLGALKKGVISDEADFVMIVKDYFTSTTGH